MGSTKSLFLTLLLLFALALSVSTVHADDDETPKMCPEGSSECCNKFNRDIYHLNEQTTKVVNVTVNGTVNSTSVKGYLPLDCELPPKFCNCTSEYWKLGPWATMDTTSLIKKSDYDNLPNTQKVQPYLLPSMNIATCCQSCTVANTGNDTTGAPYNRCAYWMHYIPPTTAKAPGCSTSSCGYCIIFPPGTYPNCSKADTCKSNGNDDDGDGEKEDEDDEYGYQWKANTYARVGKGCPGGKNDPHFVGAMGTHFDFNGAPEQSFCLMTDPKFQINMKMKGYYDTRTIGASILKDGKAVRTWIKDLGFLWLDPVTNAMHTLKLVARDGKDSARALGYMGSIEIDGSAVPRMNPGEVLSGPAGLVIKFVGYEKEGGGFFDVDAYDVSIAGMMSVEVKLRVAHPLLQTAEDAMTHINVRFMYLEHSKMTHGVLGQTFRKGREARTIDYQSLSTLLGRDIPADSDVAKGFLDGAAKDYKTTSVLSSDCMFSAFNGQELPPTI